MSDHRVIQYFAGPKLTKRCSADMTQSVSFQVAQV